MQRVKRSTAVAVLPADPAGSTPGYFALPNPGGGVPATVPGYEWYNNVQEELCAVIEAAGLTLSGADRTQLLQALIKKGFQNSVYSAAAGAGTADAITAAFNPAIDGLVAGMTLYVRATAASATTTPTFTPASGVIAAKTIVKGNNLPLAVADVAGAGHWLMLQYDQTLDKWVLLNPATGVTPVVGLGVGQTIQDVKASRANNTNYTNSTGRSIFVSVSLQSSLTQQAIQVTIDGISYQGSVGPVAANSCAASFVVPAGSVYKASVPSFATLADWVELR